MSIEVSIVWPANGHVHSKGVSVMHDACFVGHHGHSVQRWLPVEEYEITIEHVSMYDIAFFEDDGV